MSLLSTVSNVPVSIMRLGVTSFILKDYNHTQTDDTVADSGLGRQHVSTRFPEANGFIKAEVATSWRHPTGHSPLILHKISIYFNISPNLQYVKQLSELWSGHKRTSNYARNICDGPT